MLVRIPLEMMTVVLETPPAALGIMLAEVALLEEVKAVAVRMEAQVVAPPLATFHLPDPMEEECSTVA